MTIHSQPVFNHFNEKYLKTGTAIALTAGGVLLYTILTKRAALSSINFFPSAVRDIHFDGATPVMTLGLVAQNTSNQKLVVRSVAGNLAATVNGSEYQVGNISNFVTQEVNANSQSELVLQVRLQPIGIVNDLIRSLQFGNFTQALRLQAYANIDNYQVPIDLKFTIGQ